MDTRRQFAPRADEQVREELIRRSTIELGCPSKHDHEPPTRYSCGLAQILPQVNAEPMLEQLSQDWFALLSKQAMLRSGPGPNAYGTEQDEPLQFFCNAIIPALLPVLHQRFQHDYPQQGPEGHRYDGLISVLGYTPDTVILAQRFTEARRLLILHTRETAPFLPTVRANVRLTDEAFQAIEFDKLHAEQLFEILHQAVETLGRTTRIAIELTGGTKPMGATLQMAAAVYDIDTLYIDYEQYEPQYRKPRPESTYIRLMENPLKTRFNLLRPAYLGQMASAMTHQLLQPVSIIRFATQRALADMDEGLFKNDELRPLVTRVQEQADRMSAIVNGFRRFGRRTYDERLDLFAVTKGAITLFDTKFNASHTAVRLSAVQAPILVKGSQLLLEEVLLNLLSNARDALEGRPDGLIEVRTFRGDGRCGVVVSDNGPGLPPAYRNLMFTPFVSTKATNRGTGLGLFLCRRIMDDLGGSLRYEDQPVGGAQFVIELPTLDD